MKTRNIILLIALLSLLFVTCAVFADGLNPVTNQQQYQQSYPIPQMYPIGQVPNQNNYQNNTNPYQNNTNPYNYYYPQQDQQPYYYPQYQQPYNPYYNPYYNPSQPIYDPVSGQYFYPINNDYNYYPYQPQPVYPPNQDSNVQVSKKWNSNGSVSLNWMIRNISGENWDRKNIDIKCLSGCHLLTNPNQTLWDIPYTVNRGDMLSFTVNIWEPMYGETMKFAIVAGSKTIYTFNVNPN